MNNPKLERITVTPVQMLLHQNFVHLTYPQFPISVTGKKKKIITKVL
jgi:hypothetical protein